MGGREKYPVALTIAGSDSGGGAGIQADLRALAANGVFGTSAITCITAQNPDGVFAIQEVPPDIVEAQMRSVLEFFPVQCIKTGMLFSEQIIRRVSVVLRDKKIKIVLDPVMVATSGARLLEENAIKTLKEDLIPLAALLTPNLDEASVFLGDKISDIKEMKDAVYSLYSGFRVPVLLKGGHLPKTDSATDILFDGKKITEFSKPFLRDLRSHGTGCTFSSAIAAGLAKGFSLEESVGRAKEYLHRTIEQSIFPGEVSSLNHFPDH